MRELEGCADKHVQGVAERLLDAALQSGGEIFYGDSYGVSIRAKCSAWQQPISVAWLYSQAGKGWMRSQDISVKAGECK